MSLVPSCHSRVQFAFIKLQAWEENQLSITNKQKLNELESRDTWHNFNMTVLWVQCPWTLYVPSCHSGVQFVSDSKPDKKISCLTQPETKSTSKFTTSY